MGLAFANDRRYDRSGQSGWQLLRLRIDGSFRREAIHQLVWRNRKSVARRRNGGLFRDLWIHARRPADSLLDGADALGFYHGGMGLNSHSAGANGQDPVNTGIFSPYSGDFLALSPTADTLAATVGGRRESWANKGIELADLSSGAESAVRRQITDPCGERLAPVMVAGRK